jgi:hypothetical protein
VAVLANAGPVFTTGEHRDAIVAAGHVIRAWPRTAGCS